MKFFGGCCHPLHSDNAAAGHQERGLLGKYKHQQEPQGRWLRQSAPGLGRRGVQRLRLLHSRAQQLPARPSRPARVLPTRHDDIRKPQLPCNRQSPAEYHGVFSADLVHVSTKKLERNDKACKTRSFSLRPTLRLPCGSRKDRATLFSRGSEQSSAFS